MTDWSIRHGIASAKRMVHVARQHGVPLANCLSGTDITAAMIDDDASEITPEQEMRLVRNVLTALPDVEGLALEIGARYHLTDFGIWGYALLSCATLRDALRLALKYLDLSFIFGDLELEECDDELAILRFHYEAIPGDIRQFLVERDAIAILAVERLTAPRVRPIRSLRFSFPRPAHAARYMSLLGFEPEFGAAATEIRADMRQLRLPLPGANEATAYMCEAECQKLLERRRGGISVAARIRSIIRKQPSQSTDMDAIAGSLGMTARTLRRHLADEDTTFRALRETVLLTLAEEMMTAGSIKLAAIAEQLGYSDAAAFSHAYKRWKGVTPRHARQG